MPVNPYLDEFSQKYERPQVDGLIVGFSGIDPQRKSSGNEGSSCMCDPSNLTDAQKEIVRQIVREALSVIDFSSCECNPTQLTDAQKDIINNLIEQKINDLDTCDCDTSNFSDEQKEIIKTIIDERIQEFIIHYDGGEIDPNNPDPTPQPEPVDETNLNHEKLSGLLGGDENGHYHISKEELLKLAAYPNFSDIKHETLPDLLGGDDNGHFHLTEFQLNKLRIMIETFFPDGSDVVIIKPVNPDPLNPDDPDTPVEPYDPYGGLPTGTPPAWEINLLPDGYELCDYSTKMLYGSLPTLNNGLFLKVKLSSKAQYAVLNSKNLTSWISTTGFPLSSSAYSIIQSLSIPNDLWDKGNSEVAIMVFNGYAPRSVSRTTVNLAVSSSDIIAAAYSPLLQALILVGKLYIYKKTKSETLKNITSNKTINPGCAAWNPTTAVFCLTYSGGTYTSDDGETWTRNTNGTPRNLLELTYREDLDSFVAWSGNDKTFYASPDGINWTQLSDTPIPLENISTVHYEPTRQWYCAVGIGDGNAYFSKDLKHWIPTKLRNNSPVDVADVIYMPSTGLYVAIPTSGTYYYTFNPSHWTD